MKLHDVLTINTASLLQNRVRAGLSVLGIFIGIASVLCMIAIGKGAEKLIADDIDKLGGENRVLFTTRYWTSKNGRSVRTQERFNIEDALAIEAECPNVIEVLPTDEPVYRVVKTRQGHVKYAPVAGVTDNYASAMRWEVRDGRFFSAYDINNRTQVCVLGHQISIDLFDTHSPLGQEVKIGIRGSDPPRLVRFKVVGVMAPRGRTFQSGWSLDDHICVPLSASLKRLNFIPHVERLALFFSPGADVAEVIESVRSVIRRRHRNTDAFAKHWTFEGTLKRLEHFEKVIKIGLVSIAGFSLFVGGIGIMNICLVSVGEKRREIGLRKSVGARHVDIFWQFLTESVFLCLCGAFLGVAGGWFFAHGMARIAVRIVPIVEEWPVVLSVRWILISVIFSIFMGVIFGVYPAVRASRMAPIDALRTEN